MELVILSLSFSLSLFLSLLACVSGSSSAGPGSPSVPYRTVLYRTVLYSSVCINLLHECSLSQVHAYSGPALPLLPIHLSVVGERLSSCISICHFTLSVCLSSSLSLSGAWWTSWQSCPVWIDSLAVITD